MSLSSWRAWIEIRPGVGVRARCASLSSWRAWIEIPFTTSKMSSWAKRSLSSWRAWIEMHGCCAVCRVEARRSPHGERGLKSTCFGISDRFSGSLSSWRAWIEIAQPQGARLPRRRSPHGERGLKCLLRVCMPLLRWSLSSWRAWIEIGCCGNEGKSNQESLSSWRAWIEIFSVLYASLRPPVALLMESVD